MKVLVEQAGASGGQEIVQWPGGALWARVAEGSLLGGGRVEGGVGERVVVRAGQWEVDDELVDELGMNARTWGMAGWKQFEERVAAVLAEEGPTLIVRTGRHEVLSDAPSCLRFLELRSTRWGAQAERLGLLLDPLRMLTPAMWMRGEEHIERILGMVSGQPGVVGVVVGNATTASGGRMDFAQLMKLVRLNVGRDVPLVLHQAELDEQLREVGVDSSRDG